MQTKFTKIALILLLSNMLVGCGAIDIEEIQDNVSNAISGSETTVNIEYSIGPFTISIDNRGRISIAMSGRIVTPLGTFGINTIANPPIHFNVERTLTVRTNDGDAIYDVREDFSLNFNQNLEGLRFETRGNDILLDFRGVNTQSPPLATSLPIISAPQSAIVYSNATYQRFENGHMVYVESSGKVYAFTPAGWWEFNATWSSNQSIPNLNPPAGKRQPTENFGKVWYENQSLRQSIGWATRGVARFSTTIRYNGGGDFSVDGPEDFVFTFYPDGSWRSEKR